METPVRRRASALLPFDYMLFGAYLLLLVPAFHRARLPLKIDIFGMAGVYWGGTAVESMFLAVVLAVIGLPLEDTVAPLIRRFREQKARIFLPIVLAALMLPFFGIGLSLVITVDTIAITELIERRKELFESSVVDVFVPALYLFCGALLVFAFNHAIAGIKFAGTYDEAFNRLDLILFRTSVSQISHWCVNHFPLWFFRIMETVYFSLYGQMGATIVLISILRGRAYSVRYVATLVIGYSIGLIIFYIWPAIGPFSICAIHVANFPHSLAVYPTQMLIVEKAGLLWAHTLTPGASRVDVADYYIGFPCMHVALPSIAVWFLRPWKRIALCMLIFDVVLLVPSIIFLECHYIVDLIAGFAVAFVAIKISAGVARLSTRTD